MKKILKIVLLVMVVASIIFTIYYTSPKNINVTIEGIKFKIGAENKEYQEPVTIQMNGKLKRRLWKDPLLVFEGSIDIEGEHIPLPEGYEARLDILTYKAPGSLRYLYTEKGEINMYSYGGIFTNPSFTEYVIFINHQHDNGGGGWNSSKDFIISAPAKSREEALEIYNKLEPHKNYIAE